VTSPAEEALAALARDLVEEISAGRALELAADPEALELASFQVRPFSRLQKTKQGKVIPEHVKAHTELRSDLPHPGGHDPHFVQGAPGHVIDDTSQAKWLAAQQAWAKKGQALWGSQRFHDIDKPSAEKFAGHVDAAHQHLSDPDSPALAKGYEQLHEAHRTAAEQLLPRAETDQQKQSVRDSISHVQSRMRDIDKQSGVRSTRTRRLTGAVPERAARAAERLQEGPQHPAVQPEPPKLPPPPTGAQAVHPHLGSRFVTPLAGDTLSRHAHAHVPQPLPQQAPSPQDSALDQANRRLEGYAQREESQRQSDLRDHLGELRKAESGARAAQAAARAAAAGQAAPGQYAPLTDEQYAVHARDVQEKVNAAAGKGQATSVLHSRDGGYSWLPQRALEHQQILQDFLARQVSVPSEHRALVMGGLGGAGKTTVLKQIPDISLRDYAVVNPDDFKAELARRGLVPEVAGLSPLEASPLVHDESSYLADQAARLLAERGKNIAWDITMADEASVSQRLAALEQHGYTTRGVFVDSPVERAVQRAAKRYRQGLEAYREGRDPLGGRYVPPDLIRSQEVVRGITRNKLVFEALKSRFADWQLWDNNGTAPRLAEKSAPSVPAGIPSVEALLRTLQPGSKEARAQEAARAAGSGPPGTRLASPEEFASTLNKAFEGSPYSAFVNHYTAADIRNAGMTAILAAGGKAGILIHDHKDGRIEPTGLFNTSGDKGTGLALLRLAVSEHGANYIEAYGPVLPKLYASLGFRDKQVFPFDPALAAPDWNTEKFDHPDYHIMEYVGATEAQARAAEKGQVAMTAGTGMDDLDLDAVREQASTEPGFSEDAWKAAMVVAGIESPGAP
jgi:predicted kinase